ncbi:MAG: hypothetical protein AB7G75_10150 [Candidatus Binatia bacterium]
MKARQSERRQLVDAQAGAPPLIVSYGRDHDRQGRLESVAVPKRDSRTYWCGARLLLLAVLEDAVHSWFRYRHDSSTRGQRLFQETRAWFWSSDQGWLCTFENICAHLDLDPEDIRAGLENSSHTWSGSGSASFPSVTRQAF